MASRNIIVQDDTAAGTTQSYFENQYAAETYISDDIYNAVIGYFELRAYGRAAAENLAAAFIDSCTNEGRDIISALEQLKLIPDSEQTSIILFLLNSVRVGTSLLGTTLLKVPNPYTARQIIF
jgi:hypothetical protein